MVANPRLTLTEDQRKLLQKWSRGGSTPYRLVLRSRILLLVAQGRSDRSIARRLRVNPITVARWRSRFLLLGIEAIRVEAPRLGSPPPISEERVRTILHKTLFERPSPSGRWSTRSLAREVGVSHSTVRRIWKSYDVRPPRSRIAALVRNSRFRPKAIDVVGVYVNPPQRVVAISLKDDATKDSVKPTGRHGRNSSSPVPSRGSWMGDLITTLGLLEGHELKASASRLLDQEFLSFLGSVLKQRHRHEQIQLLAGASGPSQPAPLTRWLRRHPEFRARVEVGKAPLRQMVVDWLGDASAPRATDFPPASLPGLRRAVERWVREPGGTPRPFAWTRG